jgi:hypothetical protein
MRWMSQYVAASSYAAPRQAIRPKRRERRLGLSPLLAQLHLPYVSRKARAASYEPRPIHSSPSA